MSSSADPSNRPSGSVTTPARPTRWGPPPFIGAALLADVIARTASLGTDIGCRGLLIHCETPQARDFYTHLIPGFEASPTDDLHLVLLMKDIRRSIGTV